MYLTDLLLVWVWVGVRTYCQGIVLTTVVGSLEKKLDAMVALKVQCANQSQPSSLWMDPL